MTEGNDFIRPPAHRSQFTSFHWLVRKRKYEDSHTRFILQWNPASQGWTPMNEHGTWKGSQNLPASEWAYLAEVAEPDFEDELNAISRLRG